MKPNQKKRREPLFRVNVLDDGSGDQSSGTPIPSEATWRNWFESEAKHPYTWKIKADGLMRSANVLLTQAREDIKHVADSGDIHVQPPVLGAYVMIAGLAIENLLKGILVMRYQHLDIKVFMEAIRGHDLNLLARDAGLGVDQRDSFLLEKVTSYTIWAGKYPAPLGFDEFVPCDYPDGGWGPVTVIAMSDSVRIQSLFNRLESMFESEFESMKRPVDNRSGT